MRARVAIALVLGSAPIAAQGAPGELRFSATTYPGVPFASEIECVDLDGDGDLDLVVSGSGNQLHAYLGAGDGTFSGAVTTPVSSSVTARVSAGDFDGDGCTDLARMTGSVQVLMSNCDGTFTAGAPITFFSTKSDVLVADVNGDGRSDVVTSSGDLGLYYVHVHLGQGDGTFVRAALMAPPDDHLALVAGDVNADGITDAIGLLFSPMAVYFGLLGTGPCCTASLPGVGSTAAATGDFVKDGRPDLAVSRGAGIGNYVLDVHPESSMGEYGSPVTTELSLQGASWGTLLTADFDGDGRLDLAGRTGVSGAPSLAIVRGKGNGSFAAALSGLVPDQASAARVGDFDADGLPDLAVAHATESLVSVLINQSVPSLWVDVGLALAGSSGMPLLSGTGSLTAASATTLELLHAAPSSPAVLVAGTTQLALPILGGVLVPSPEVLVFGLTTTAHGTLAFSFTWPSGIPTGATLYFQAWTADALAVQGWSASNGLAATVP